MIVNCVNDESRNIRIMIIVSFKLNEKEQYWLILSKIGKDEEIKEKARSRFENLKRIKEIKGLVNAEIEREKEKVKSTKLESIEFDGDKIEIVIFSRSKSSFDAIESYVYMRLALLEMSKKIPHGITINKDPCRIIAKNA